MRYLIALCLLILILMLAAAHAAPPKFGKVAGASASTAAPVATLFADGFDGFGCHATINPDGIERHRVTVSDVGYTAQQLTRARVQLDDYGLTFSYNSAAPGPVLPWPGLTGSAPTVKAFRMDSYVAWRFTTPAQPPAGFATTVKIPSGVGSPRVTLSISRACGDFSKYLPAPGCLVVGPPPDDSVLYQYFAPPGSAACPLKPGTTYYMNAMFTDTTDRTRCTFSPGQTCRLAIWR
jgi:hypothetical protein